MHKGKRALEKALLHKSALWVLPKANNYQNAIVVARRIKILNYLWSRTGDHMSTTGILSERGSSLHRKKRGGQPYSALSLSVEPTWSKHAGFMTTH